MNTRCPHGMPGLMNATHGSHIVMCDSYVVRLMLTISFGEKSSRRFPRWIDQRVTSNPSLQVCFGIFTSARNDSKEIDRLETTV